MEKKMTVIFRTYDDSRYVIINLTKDIFKTIKDRFSLYMDIHQNKKHAPDFMEWLDGNIMIVDGENVINFICSSINAKEDDEIIQNTLNELTDNKYGYMIFHNVFYEGGHCALDVSMFVIGEDGFYFSAEIENEGHIETVITDPENFLHRELF